MIAQERYLMIEKLLSEKKIILVSELTRLFGVSIETIRRDLAHLEKKGVLKRVHGGAVKDVIDVRQSEISKREGEFWEQKTQIGNFVSKIIGEGDTIAMDSGTTNHAVARVLKSKFHKLTVLTNYLPIVNELADSDFSVVSTGGMLQGSVKSFTGEIAEENISRFHVDKAFITMSGISLVDGFTDFGFNEIAIKRKLMSAAAQVYVVADSSKFGVVSLMKVCDIDGVKAVVTDSDLNEAIKSEFSKNGVKIINS